MYRNIYSHANSIRVLMMMMMMMSIPQSGRKMSKRLGGIIGCKDKKNLHGI